MVADEFDAMDNEAGVSTPAELVSSSGRTLVASNGVAAYRAELVRQYHGGSSSLVAALRSQGMDDAESLVASLIDEVIKETDNLLGNHLVATENGDLRDASVISYKRAEVLEKAIKAIQTKQTFERVNGIDVDSPSMAIVFRFFMSKTKLVFQRMGLADEQIDLFFQTLGEEMENWKKELREEFEELKVR